MIRHYIKLAIKNLRASKVISVGSFATLFLGSLCISFLYLYVHNELTMDDFHADLEDIYVVGMKPSPESDWKSPYKLNAEEYPEIKALTEVLMYKEDEMKFYYNSNIYTPQGIVIDSNFFKVNDYKLSIGDRHALAKDPEALMISEAYSKQLFGDANPIGQRIEVETYLVQGPRIVKGVFKIPVNSSLNFDYLLPKGDKRYSRMGLFMVKLNKKVDALAFNEKIKTSNNNVAGWSPKLTESVTQLFPFKEFYFNTQLTSLKELSFFKKGDKASVRVLFLIIVVLFVISVLNYSNLQIVTTNNNIKNTIIQKINGALKRDILTQKLVETSLVILIAAFFITIFYNLLAPYFNDFTKVELAPPVWKIFLLNTVVLSLIALVGLVYPSVIVYRFSDTNNFNQNISNLNLKGKKPIVITQFVLTIVLFVSAVVVDKQLELLLSKDLGFKTEHIVKTKLVYEFPLTKEFRSLSMERRKEEYNKFMLIPQYIKSQLLADSSIESTAQGMSLITPFTIDFNTKNPPSDFQTIHCLRMSPEYQSMFGLELVQGRFFNSEMDKKRGGKIMINEAAAALWNIKDIEQTRIYGRSWNAEKGYEIVGVVKDFNFQHLSAKPKPLVMMYWGDPEEDFFIKLHKDKTKEGLERVESLFKEINPNQLFKYSFLKDDIDALYIKEQRLSVIYKVFTFVSLFISVIGLFTIALYDTRKRTKEIGIRKVNGASQSDIILMLNKNFLSWVLLAFVIASPIAYYFLNNWLQNFTYRVPLSISVFLIVGLTIFSISIVTVTWQSYTAAIKNPSESITDE